MNKVSSANLAICFLSFLILCGCEKNTRTFWDRNDFNFETLTQYEQEFLDGFYIWDNCTMIDEKCYYKVNKSVNGLFPFEGFLRFQDSIFFFKTRTGKEQILFDLKAEVGKSWLVTSEQDYNYEILKISNPNPEKPELIYLFEIIVINPLTSKPLSEYSQFFYSLNKNCLFSISHFRGAQPQLLRLPKLPS